MGTRRTISLKNNKFFDITRKNLKSLPHRSEFPPFNLKSLVGAVLLPGKVSAIQPRLLVRIGTQRDVSDRRTSLDDHLPPIR
jgi:hypothetical protein